MSDPQLAIKPRKQPQQARSRQMQADILEAAIRVLETWGMTGFTTIRIAEAAGISVGSLYQYFPNKQAILFALQRQTILAAWRHVSGLMDDQDMGPGEKISAVAQYFFIVESGEARQMGKALRNAELVDAKNEELQEINAQVLAVFSDFLAAVRENGKARADPVGDAAFLIATLDALGHFFADRVLDDEEMTGLAGRTATMICAHLGIENE